MKNPSRILTSLLVLALAGLACRTLTGATETAPTKTPAPAPTAGPTLVAPIVTNQPYVLTGTFKGTSEVDGQFSDNILYAERQVILFDLHGFITRNRDWELPVTSQVLGHVQYNPQDASGSYQLFLPEVPQGTLNDLDNNGKSDSGVQVFAVDYEPNITGDPFMSGDDRLRGWPANLASVKTDPDNKNEITGGKVLVYAPDEHQGFPSGPGADGLLFTADDPIAPLPAGYSVVDLDVKPYAISQTPQVELKLYEAPDAGPKDYSADTYTGAFDKLVKFLRSEYAFNGIPGKEPDWNALVASLRPRVEKAEKDKDATAFYEALRDFTYAFKDGHVGMNAGDYSTKDFQQNYLGSLGFTLRVSDDNQVLVSSVLPGSSAEQAGMKPGATITRFNDQPVMDALKSQILFFGNQSSEIGTMFGKAISLTRTKPGGQARVTFTNPGGQSKTADLTAAPEVDSLLKELGVNKNEDLLPVELQTLSVNGQDYGYIKLNSNMDDLNLILRLFERGLKKFQEAKVAGLIIDLRNNGGGVPLGLAGFLTQQDIPLSQLEYFDSKTGKFASDREADKITANQNQYHFDKIAVLVGLNCASACEIEAYGFSKLPGAQVVGEYPTAGVEAEVSHGQVKMPEGIQMQFPTGRMVLPDGSLFLEGVGVQPGVKVPINAQNITSSQDVILQAAEDALAR